MTRQYTNNYITTLNGAINNSTTTIVVTSVADLPTVGSGDTCRLTIDDGTNIEIVQVTSNSTTTLTVVRAQEGTSGTAFADAVAIELRSTAASFIDPAGVIDFGGATSLEIPNSASPTLDANGEIAVDTSVTDFSAGVLEYYSGEVMGVVAMPIAEFTTPTDGHVVSYNATTDEFELAAGGVGGGDAWSDAVDADIVPDADGTRDLGTTINRFAELHVDTVDVAGGATLGSSSLFFSGGSSTTFNFGHSGGTPFIIGPDANHKIQTNNDGFTISFGSGQSVQYVDSGAITYTGAALAVNMGGIASLEIPNSATPTVNADGEVAIDTTVTDMSAGVMKYYSGEEMAVVAMPIAELTSPTDTHVVTYNATTDEFELAAGGGGGGPSQATQSALEAETNEDTYAPPDLIKHSPGVAKAWAVIEYTTGTPAVTASYNITSVADNGTGDSTITIANDFSSALWSAPLQGFNQGAFEVRILAHTLAAGTIRVQTYDNAPTITDFDYTMAGFGDQ